MVLYMSLNCISLKKCLVTYFSPDILVHAPPGMNDVIAGAQYFMRFDNSGVNFKIESSYGRHFTDGEMTVYPILIEAGKHLFLH